MQPIPAALAVGGHTLGAVVWLSPPQLTQSTSSVWQLRRHSAPGVPTEALPQSRYTMGATHPAEGGHAGRPRGQGPHPRPAEALPSPAPRGGPGT